MSAENPHIKSARYLVEKLSNGRKPHGKDILQKETEVTEEKMSSRKAFIIFSVSSVSSCKKIFPDLVLPFC
jgi:hypothetical protein